MLLLVISRSSSRVPFDLHRLALGKRLEYRRTLGVQVLYRVLPRGLVVL